MAPIKIERVVSVSSEDEAHPAANLLKIDYSNKKWKCKTPGEKQITAVFQLAECCKISSIDIGNEHSAFIEILVGKSCLPDDEYKVLLVTSSLMTLQEAKNGTNINGVSFFKKESLCKPVCDEKWDRIKIVCTQPFNKYAQYGLSFIVLHGETTLDTNSPQLGNLQLKATASVEPLLKVGGLFANRNKLSNDPPIITGAAAIRAAATSGNVKVDFKGKVPHKNDSLDSPEVANINEVKQKKKQAIPRNEEKMKKKPNINGNATSSTNTTATPSPHTKTGGSSLAKKVVRASVQAFKKREERPFGNLMSGVAFVLSGYENPLRSELRNKALAMGARYEANWNRSCTHLICAFKNTPKYNQVRGQGKIVKREWIEECYSRRVRLPWRRFALDTNEASQPESEEEIYELVERSTPSKKRSACRDSSDGDTDDEIEKVRQKQRKQNGCIPTTSGASSSSGGSSSHNNAANLIAQVSDSGINNSSSQAGDSDQEGVKNIVNKEATLKEKKETDNKSTTTPSVELKKESINKEETSVYDMDTESEDENYWIKNKPEESTLPPLPAFFQGATIALLDDLSETDRKLLTRYIKAHYGTIAHDGTDLNTILYAITEDVAAIERVREDYPQVIGVTPEWIWRSHDESRLLPASSFKV